MSADIPPPFLPRWLPTALAEIGVREIPGGQNTPRIIEYHEATHLRAVQDEVAWCSSYCCWVMQQVGIKHHHNAAARAWLTWGEALVEPAYGCIAVLARGAAWQGHVGFLLAHTTTTLTLLGGNQGDAVSVQEFPRSSLLGMRWR